MSSVRASLRRMIRSRPTSSNSYLLTYSRLQIGAGWLLDYWHPRSRWWTSRCRGAHRWLLRSGFRPSRSEVAGRLLERPVFTKGHPEAGAHEQDGALGPAAARPWKALVVLLRVSSASNWGAMVETGWAAESLMWAAGSWG